MSNYSDLVKKIKEQSDIITIAKLYFKNLEQVSSSRYVTNCTHDGGDKNASLNFYPESQRYYCYGCGAGGNDSEYKNDVFGLVQWQEQCTFNEAVAKLAKLANIPMLIDPVLEEEKTKLLDMNRQFWVNLQNNKDAKNYIYNRGFNDNDIDKYRIGCTITEPIKIVVPILDKHGDTIAFGRRFLYDSDRSPKDAKWVNSSTSSIFKKSQILYGLDTAIPLIKMENFIIIVEGYFDVMMLQKYGVPAVGTMGTTVTKEHVELLEQYSKTIYLFFDGDAPGVTATLNSISQLDKNNSVIYVINIDTKDPDDIAIEHKEKTLEYIKANAIRAGQYRLNKIISTYNEKVHLATNEVLNNSYEILQDILNINDKIFYINQINKILGGDYTNLILRGVIQNGTTIENNRKTS